MSVPFPLRALVAPVTLGLCVASPAAANCDLLGRMADMPATMAIAAQAEASAAPAAMDALAAAQQQVSLVEVETATAAPALSDYATPLQAYARALEPVGDAALAGDAGTVAQLAGTYGITVGADLARRLLSRLDCEHVVQPVPRKVVEDARPTGIAGQIVSIGEAVPGGTLTLAAGVIGLTAALTGALLYLAGSGKRRRGPWRERRHARHSCRYQAILKARGESHTTLLVDVSRLGGQITARMELKKLERVVLCLDARQIAATVKWCTEDFVGLHFEYALSEEDLAAILHAPAKETDASATPVPAQ